MKDKNAKIIAVGGIAILALYFLSGNNIYTGPPRSVVKYTKPHKNSRFKPQPVYHSQNGQTVIKYVKPYHSSFQSQPVYQSQGRPVN